MKIREILVGQFTNCFDENGWFVALTNALEGVTAEDAAWKPPGVDNSIREIANHLNFYNYAYLERFKGVDYEYPVTDNDATFVTADNATDEEWAAEIGRLESILREFRDLMAAADDDRFDEAVSSTNQSTWSTLISNINAHNAHHGGQIVLLRKLQGSWDRAKGVS